MDKRKLQDLARKTITPKASASSLYICLKRMDAITAKQFLELICEADSYLAVKTANLAVDAKKHNLLYCIKNWLTERISENGGLRVVDLSAILELQAYDLFLTISSILSSDLIREFYQVCPCQLGCRLLYYCYRIPNYRLTELCEIMVGQILNRYETEADEDLKMLLPGLYERNVLFLINKIIEVMGEDKARDFFGIDTANSTSSIVSSNNLGPDTEQETTETNFNIEKLENLSISQIRDLIANNHLARNKQDILLFSYIDRFLSEPHSEQELLTDGLWFVQMNAYDENDVLCWFYLSAIENLGENHSLISCIGAFCSSEDPPHKKYIEKCCKSLESYWEQPEKLLHWIDLMDEANPFSFALDYLVHISEGQERYLTILENYLHSNLDMGQLAKIFFNTPLRATIPVRVFFEKITKCGKLDILLDAIKKYRFLGRCSETKIADSLLYLQPVLYDGPMIVINKYTAGIKTPVIETKKNPKTHSSIQLTYYISGYQNGIIEVMVPGGDRQHLEFMDYSSLNDHTITDSRAITNKSSAITDCQIQPSFNGQENNNPEYYLETFKPKNVSSGILLERGSSPWENTLRFLSETAERFRNGDYKQKSQNYSRTNQTTYIQNCCKYVKTIIFQPDLFENTYDFDRLSLFLIDNADLLYYFSMIVRAMHWNNEFSKTDTFIQKKYFFSFKKYATNANRLFQMLFQKGLDLHCIFEFYFRSIYKVILPFEKLLSFGAQYEIVEELKNWPLRIQVFWTDTEPQYRFVNIRCSQNLNVKRISTAKRSWNIFAICEDYELIQGVVSNIVLQELMPETVSDKHRSICNAVFGSIGKNAVIPDRTLKDIAMLPPANELFWQESSLPLRCMEDAVLIRKNTPNSMLELLEILGNRNPFCLETDARIELFYLRIMRREDNSKRFQVAMLSFITNVQSGSDLVKIYLNTCLKYYISVNELWVEVKCRKPQLLRQFEDELQKQLLPGVIDTACMLWCPYLQQGSTKTNMTFQDGMNSGITQVSKTDKWIAGCTVSASDLQKVCRIISCILIGYQTTAFDLIFLQDICKKAQLPLDDIDWEQNERVDYDSIIETVICNGMSVAFIQHFQRIFVERKNKEKNLMLPASAFSIRALDLSWKQYIMEFSKQLKKYQYYEGVKPKILEEISLLLRSNNFQMQDLLSKLVPKLIREYLYLFRDLTIVDDLRDTIRLICGAEAEKMYMSEISKLKVYQSMKHARPRY